MTIQLLSMKAVLEKTSLSRSQIYRMLGDGSFPRPIPIGARRAFVGSEIDDWILCRIAEARAA